MAFNATSSACVSTQAGVGKGAGVEWCCSEVGTGRIRAPVVLFDDRGKKSNVVAVTLFDGTLGAFVIWWNEKGRVANAVRAVSTTIEGTKVLAETATLRASN